MSFLLDPPALVLLGALIGRRWPRGGGRGRVAAGVVVVFLVASGLLYLDVLPWWWGGWIAGSDWMLNSGLGTGLDRSGGTDVLAVILFAAYPLWLRLGLDLGTGNLVGGGGRS